MLVAAWTAAHASDGRGRAPDRSCEARWLTAGPLQARTWSCRLPTGHWHVRPEPDLPGFALWRDDERLATVVRGLRRDPLRPLGSLLPALAAEGHVPADGCRFVRARGLAPRAGVTAWEIRPHGARLAALRRTPRDQVPEPPCGEYGASTHGVRWFLVDPGHPDWVIHVDEGQDGTLIDPATVRVR